MKKVFIIIQEQSVLIFDVYSTYGCERCRIKVNNVLSFLPHLGLVLEHILWLFFWVCQ